MLPQDIERYFRLRAQGDATILERLDMLHHRDQLLAERTQQIETQRQFLARKIETYNTQRKEVQTINTGDCL